MTPRRPPRLADWLLRQAIPPGVRGDTILGDVREEFAARSDSRWRAAWWYRTQAAALAVRYAWVRLRRGSDPHLDDRLLSERPPMFFDNLRNDLRFAVRVHAKQPGFTAVLLTTLALGIGASTAIFSMADGIVLRPLAYPDSNRLVYATETTGPQANPMSLAWPNYLDWRQRSHAFAGLAAAGSGSYTLTGVERPQRLLGWRVTADFFDVIGVRPNRGRGFAASEFEAGAPPTVIVSDGFWRRQLGADPAAIGRTLTLDARAYTIVGVLPPGFRHFRDNDVYLALAPEPNSSLLDRGNHQGLYALGRLKDGVTVDAAEAELKAIAAGLARAYPNTNSGNGARALRLVDATVSDVRLMLLVLLGAVLFLLLLACVNVANLLVARGAARQHELAVRAALGGGRLRLVRQLLVESACVCAAGGALGVLVAWGLLHVLIALAPQGTPRLDEVQIDRAALVFALTASAVCGVIFGAFPAFQASSARGQHVLVRAHGTAGAAAQSHRVQRALMVVEVALALMLLAGAGLMARTLHALATVDPGFVPDRVLTLRLTLAGAQWTAPKRVAFYDEVVARVQAIPGIADAGLAYSLPIDGSNWNSVFIARDTPVPPRAELPSAAFTPVTAGLFHALSMRLERGRLFDAGDRENSRRVAIVNETLARRLWPGESPIGKQLKQGWPETPPEVSPWREVIGVVGDVKFEGVAADTPMQVYLPFVQEPARAVAIVVRTTGDPKGVAPAIESAVRELDRDLPLYQVRSLSEMMDGAVARERVSMAIFLVFAALALVLASVGLYGVVAHGVTERTHEIGVRMALGADPRDVRRLFVRQGLVTSAAGAAFGLGGALLVGQWIEKLLFGVKATDAPTLAAVVVLLLAVSSIACYLPARKATRVSPTAALRTE